MSDPDYDFVPEFRSTNIPKQKAPSTPIFTVDTMGPPVSSIASFPPLGQVTQSKPNTDVVPFIVYFQVDEANANDSWEICLWHSSAGGDWSASPLTLVPKSRCPSSLQETNSAKASLYFSGSVPNASPLSFTIKFRHNQSQSWRWVHDEQGSRDGVVVVSPDIHSQGPSDLSDIIIGLNQNLKVKSVMSQTPNTDLWTVEGDIGPASEKSAYADVELGTPWGEYLRWFALVRQSSPWLAPRHGKSSLDLDSDAIMCSFLSPGGRHLVLLGISDRNNTIALLRNSRTQPGAVTVHLRSDNPAESTGLVLAAAGDSFESALAAVMYHARDVVFASAGSSVHSSNELQALDDEVEPKWLEEWYDGLGYCTWNALGQDLTEEKVLTAIDALEEQNVHISSLIIDDNWQDIDESGKSQFHHGWNSFEAQPNAFPSGLKHTVSRIRAKHSSIKHVAVWHALLGYWGGISPKGQLAQTYKTVDIVRENTPKRDMDLEGPMTVIAKEDVRRFYNDFYHFLSTCGIDAVKTDVQFMLDTWASAKERRELTTTYLDAWMIATLRHFSSRAISCMSQAPQVLFHQQLPRNRPPLLVRNSDDFFPQVPASHPWHLWANAHNSLLTQHLNVLPDWDMFQTVHEYSGFHAAARCLSGGPIYITDTPGEYNFDIINQITGRTPRGNTVIFRPSVVGKSIDHYDDYHDDVILKIGSYHGRAATGTPLLGVFNVSQKPLRELIPLSQLPGVLPSLKYVVRAHNTGSVTSVMVPDEDTAYLPVVLDIRGFDILTAFPVAKFESGTRGTIYTANIGLIRKMTGAAAITSNEFSLLPTGRVVLDTRLKALGVLGLYISTLAELSIERHFMVTIQGQPIPPHTVTKSTVNQQVLEVDVETAWEEMGLEAGWSNEVEVKVYFSIEKDTESSKNRDIKP